MKRSSLLSLLCLSAVALGAPSITLGAAAGGGMATDLEELQRSATVASQASARESKLQTKLTLRGGHVAAGVAMRNRGAGTIKLTGVPKGAKIRQAYLYWVTLNKKKTSAMARGRINGKPVAAKYVGGCREPCWGAGKSHVFRADVTKHVKGNGSYRLSEFASGSSSGGDPWKTAKKLPLLEGATLMVVYEDNKSPLRTVVLYDGCKFFTGLETFNMTLQGFKANNASQAKLTVFGADGQVGVGTRPIAGLNRETLTFNGKSIASGTKRSPWNGADGKPLPLLWDTHSYDVSKHVSKNATRVTVGNKRVPRGLDCMVWAGTAFQVTTDR